MCSGSVLGGRHSWHFWRYQPSAVDAERRSAETGRDGLVLHEAVQQAIAAALRSADPERYRSLRRATWRQLREEAADAGTPDHGRHRANSLYVIENPVCREAFFPTGAQVVTVEPVRSGHERAVRGLIDSREPPDAAQDRRPGGTSRSRSCSTVRAPSSAPT